MRWKCGWEEVVGGGSYLSKGWTAMDEKEGAVDAVLACTIKFNRISSQLTALQLKFNCLRCITRCHNFFRFKRNFKTVAFAG